jgi:hypothetical protein
VFPGDTLKVDGEAKIKKKTNSGYTLVEIGPLLGIRPVGRLLAFFEPFFSLPRGGFIKRKKKTLYGVMLDVISKMEGY